jgi:hypothetical protein
MDILDEPRELCGLVIVGIPFDPDYPGSATAAPVALSLRRRVLVCEAPLDAMDRTVMDWQLE